MSRYKAYPEYRNSGVEWVGAIPNSWEVSPLFSLASTDVLRNDDGAENNVLSLSYGKIIRRDVEDNHGLLPESFNTYQLVEAGDIILRLTDLQNDKRSLRVGLATEKGIITSAYLKLTAKQKFLDRYLYRLLHSYDTTKVFYGMGGGLRQSMKFEEMRRLQMLCPSLDEQKQIADFLDHETAKIDALIEKQQRLIELLKEKRQAVISHAVTKGLNPNVPMKDSGVQWLGEMPAHWELLKGGYIGKLFGSEAVSDDDVVSEGEFPFIKVSSLGTDGLEISNFDFYVSKPASLRVSFSCDYLVFPKRGAAIFTNKVNYVDVASAIDPNLMGWKINEKAKPAYIAHLLKLRGLGDIADVSTVPQINNKHIEPMKFPVPPVNEQMQILSYLNDELTIFDSVSEKAQAAIALAQERRTALISAAVTGKIDVRDWQATA